MWYKIIMVCTRNPGHGLSAASPLPPVSQDRTISKNLRIGLALGEIGPSVLVGAITTFLGIMVMAFASNVIFRVFFKMFFIIITFGVRFAMLRLPATAAAAAAATIAQRCSASFQ